MLRTNIATRFALAVFAAMLLVSFTATAASAGTVTYKKSDGAWLGIYMQEMNRDLAEAFGFDVNEGVFVDDVVDESPADEAGLRSKDIVVQFDGKEVRDPDDLVDLMKDYEPGDKVTVKVIRDNDEKEFAVELGESKTPESYSVWTDDDRSFGPRRFNFNFGKGGYLGVSTVELSRQLADYFGVDYGVLVEEVDDDSPASKAGLKAGDIITKVGIEQVDEPSDLAEIIRDHEEGDEVELTVYRDKQEMKLTATLEESSNSNMWSNADPMILNVPNIPNAPNLGNLRFYMDDDEREEFEEDMRELREELDELREELQVIQEKMK